MAPRALPLALLLVGSATAAGDHHQPEFHRYIVVGAGPAGVQLAHYLDSAGRDYLVLDKAAAAGSFFARFPRWRQLISINKPMTGGHQLDFVTRQDWNSLNSEHSTSNRAQVGSFNYSSVPCLLKASARAGPGGRKGAASMATAPTLVSDGATACVAADFSSTDPAYTSSSVAPGLRFTELSGEYYPHADLLYGYLGRWATRDAPRGGVHQRDTPSGRDLRLALNVSIVHVARAEGYEAALEAAGGSQAALVAAGLPRFALTASDGRVFTCVTLVWAAGMQRLNVAEGANVADVAESYWTHSTDPAVYVNRSVLVIGRGNAAFEVANHLLGVASLVHVVGRDTARLRLATETHYPGDVRHVHSRLLESYLLKSQDGLAELPQGAWELRRDEGGSGGWRIHDTTVTCRRDAYGRPLERCLLGRAYDHVISCPGWYFDASPFDPSIRPALAPNRKHPALLPDYSAPRVAGLYFGGTLAHASDYRVSSGGFIHGFRYALRALHRHLEEVEQAAASERLPAALTALVAPSSPPLSPPPASWPRRPVSSLSSAVSALLRRMNHAAGPFQMFGTLADVLVLPPLHVASAAGFSTVGTLAPFVDPASFWDGNVSDPLLCQAPPRGPPDGAEAAAQRSSDAAISTAVSGFLFEEVPLRMVHLKAPGWAAQHTSQPARNDPLSTSSGGGVEYITLTLEFGGKGGKQPDGSYSYGLPDTGASSGKGVPSSGKGKGKGRAATPLPTRRPVKSEWDADPYALWRANASFWTAHQSRFLHPVLRYFHSRLIPGATELGPGDIPAMVLEHHVLEDFNNAFTHFSAHVLSVARFLQDVGARRIGAARAIAAAPRAGANTVQGPGQQAGAAAHSREGSLRVSELQWLLTPLFTLPQPPKAPMVEYIRPLMHMPYSTLYFRGHEFPGGESWFHALSMAAADDLLYGKVGMIAMHWVDTAPFPLTPEENATLRAMIDDAKPEGTSSGSHLSRVKKAVHLSFALPEMSAAEAASQAAEEDLIRRFNLARTQAAPDVPILVVKARNGMARLQSEEMGIPRVPYMRLIDLAQDRQKDMPHAHVMGEMWKWDELVRREGSLRRNDGDAHRAQGDSDTADNASDQETLLVTDQAHIGAGKPRPFAAGKQT